MKLALLIAIANREIESGKNEARQMQAILKPAYRMSKVGYQQKVLSVVIMNHVCKHY